MLTKLGGQRAHRVALVSIYITSFALLQACGPKDPPRSAEAKPSAAAINPQNWPRTAPPKFKTGDVEQRVDQLLKSLSVEEKVAQIVQPDIGTVTPEDVRRYKFGSILNGGNSGPRGNDLAPAPEWLSLADEFYAAAMDVPEGKQPIPIMWGVDAVHGHNNIIGATFFPHNIALGATRNADLIRRIGEVTARELRVTGLEWTFAPTVAVVQDVRWGRSYESYSERADLVAEYSRAMVLGLQGEPATDAFLSKEKVISTAKHFVADGGTFEGRDQGDARIDEAELRDVHAAGYPAAIEAGVQVIMASFSSWQGEKLHAHKGLLTTVLKERWGFDGFVVGDWNAHGQVPGCSNVSCPAAINAGLDMFMAPDSWRELYDNTLKQVKAGEIPMERLDDAVRRILRVKVRAGLFEMGKPSSRPLAGEWAVLGSPEHREVARQAARESLVLLKNENALLPLNAKSRVLVAGDGANSLAKQNGGWSLSWQGSGIPNSTYRNAETIFDGIRAAVSAGGGSATLSVEGSFKTRPDVAIVVFGEDPYAEFQGDIETLEYQPGTKSDLALLKKLREAKIPVVSVFLSGRPMWVNPELNASDAFVAAWLPGTEGGGVADVLFKKADGSVNHDFKGRLPVSWPRLPVPQEDAEPLFAYGYGLTYNSKKSLSPLSEEVPARVEQGTSTRTYFAAGKPGNGWQLAVGEGESQRQALSNNVGNSSTNALTVTAIDRGAQEDGRLLTWSGAAPATFAIQTAAPVDLQRESNGQLSLAFDYRVEAPASAPVTLGFECGDKCVARVPFDAQLKAAKPGTWQPFKMLLRCFEQQGGVMRTVTAPFTLSTAGSLKMGIANVRLESGLADTVACN